MDTSFYSPVEILPGPGVPILNVLQKVVVKTGRGLGLWRLVKLGTSVVPSWRYLRVIGPDGEPFHLDLRHDGFSLVTSGFMTANVSTVLSRLPVDSIILDVGANIGVWTRLFAARARLGTVYAFEPSPANAALLRLNAARHPNIRVYEVAFGDCTGTVYLAEQKQASLRHITEAKEKGSVQVQSETLDDWVSASGITRLDFMKLDVEGFEEHVLLHGENTLLKFAPVVCFEYIPQLAAARSLYKGKRLFNFLTTRGYRVWRLDKTGALFSDINSAEDWTNDYLALPSKWAWLAH